jgi:hypothetical protein
VTLNTHNGESEKFMFIFPYTNWGWEQDKSPQTKAPLGQKPPNNDEK